MLYAIGAGPQVTAVDSYSNYPADAPITDLSALEPNVEAIAAKQPDLVIVADDTAGLTASLGQLDIPVLSLPAATTFDDVYQQIEQLGVATGHVGEAAELVGQMKSRIDAIVKGLPPRTTPLTYYHELDNTYFSATSKTFIGQVYALLGLQNIADQADPDGSGYPQLSQEYIIQSNPDLIFLADTVCCAQDAATVKARPGWDQLKAVQSGARRAAERRHRVALGPPHRGLPRAGGGRGGQGRARRRVDRRVAAEHLVLSGLVRGLRPHRRPAHRRAGAGGGGDAPATAHPPRPPSPSSPPR